LTPSNKLGNKLDKKKKTNVAKYEQAPFIKEEADYDDDSFNADISTSNNVGNVLGKTAEVNPDSPGINNSESDDLAPSDGEDESSHNDPAQPDTSNGDMTHEDLAHEHLSHEDWSQSSSRHDDVKPKAKKKRSDNVKPNTYYKPRPRPTSYTKNWRRSETGEAIAAGQRPKNCIVNGWDVSKFLFENDKYQTLAGVRDSSILEKGEFYNKLLGQLLYQTAKTAVLYSPFCETKNKINGEFFAKVFDIFFDHFPYICELQESNYVIAWHKNKRNPRMFMRNIMQGYYIVLLSKYVANVKNSTGGEPSADPTWEK